MSKLLAPLAGLCLALSVNSLALANDAAPTAPPAEEAEQPAVSDETTSSAGAETSATDTKRPETVAKSTVEEVAEMEDDPIVCKRVSVTGTRVTKTKICKTQSEWRQMMEAARETMKSIDRKSSPQPGGEQLPRRGG